MFAKQLLSGAQILKAWLGLYYVLRFQSPSWHLETWVTHHVNYFIKLIFITGHIPWKLVIKERVRESAQESKWVRERQWERNVTQITSIAIIIFILALACHNIFRILYPVTESEKQWQNWCYLGSCEWSNILFITSDLHMLDPHVDYYANCLVSLFCGLHRSLFMMEV